VRLYTSNDDTHFYIDDVFVDVFCAANEELAITFADWIAIGDPAEPGPECDPEPCVPEPMGNYGWEDEEATAFNTTGNITIIQNTGPVNGVSPNSGDRMLWARQGNFEGTPQVWVAFIENLDDGDEIDVWLHGYDDQPGMLPRMRMWGHRALSGDPQSVVSSFGGEFMTYTSGFGWEQLHERWTFDSQGGPADALMVQMRLYAGEDDTDFYIDDIAVHVCSNNPNVKVTFPDGYTPPPGPCDDYPAEAPTVEGWFGWEDGKSTILGMDDGQNGNIVAANVDEPVNSGGRSLRVTEAPHVGGHTPRVFLAFIEHLQEGDIIHGRFHAFDDTPGENPRVRIFGRRAYSGDVNSGGWSHGGNNEPTSGIGWEEICHTWVYDGGLQGTDALVIEARIYSFPTSCEECSTDYHMDDLYVGVWGNANATITLPDGSVIGEPPGQCPGDLNGDATVDVSDLLILLGSWGPCSGCPADLNFDGVVDVSDLLILLGSWGPCY
jgi:hypothetical protein